MSFKDNKSPCLLKLGSVVSQPVGKSKGFEDFGKEEEGRRRTENHVFKRILSDG